MSVSRPIQPVNRDDETADTAGQSIWFAIDHPDHGRKWFLLTRALAVGRGVVCLPESTNKVTHTPWCLFACMTVKLSLSRGLNNRNGQSKPMVGLIRRRRCAALSR